MADEVQNLSYCILVIVNEFKLSSEFNNSLTTSSYVYFHVQTHHARNYWNLISKRDLRFWYVV